jgi:DNA-binding XRE family transcriptional regulator
MEGKTILLKKLRQDLKSPEISQESMARRAGIVLQTYRKAESGSDLLLSTATAIWQALNTERHFRGLEAIGFEQLWVRDECLERSA